MFELCWNLCEYFIFINTSPKWWKCEKNVLFPVLNVLCKCCNLGNPLQERLELAGVQNRQVVKVQIWHRLLSRYTFALIIFIIIMNKVLVQHSGGRYPIWFNSMFEFCQKMIHSIFDSILLCPRFNSKYYSIQKKICWFNSKDNSIQ